MTRLRHLAVALLLCSPVAADPLVVLPPLAPDVAALPRLAEDTPTATTINAALEELDRRDLAHVTCDGGTSGQPYRSVDTLSKGPRFLSFLVALGGFCEGAAHPFAQRELVTFDLDTGLRTDLLDLLPPDWSDPREAASRLYTLYRANLVTPMTDDCRATFDDTLANRYLSFDLGPDLRSQELVLLPKGLPYVAIACEGEAWVSLDQLRAAGFSPRLLEALAGTP